MISIGNRLKQAREAKDLSLAQAEEETKIRRKYLEALEAGRPEELPGEVYLKGFLRSYANYLGLDGTALVASYKQWQAEQSAGAGEAAAGRRPQPEAVPPAVTAEAAAGAQPPPERRPGAGASVRGLRPSARPAGRPWLPVLVMLVVGAVVASIFAFGRQRPAVQPVDGGAAPPAEAPAAEPPTGEPEPHTEPEPAPPAEPAPVPAPEVKVGEPVGGETVPITVSEGPIEVSLTWRERSWVRITVDGAVLEEVTLLAGAVRHVRGQHEVRVRVGYTEVVGFTVNGQDLGPVAREPERTVVITVAHP